MDVLKLYLPLGKIPDQLAHGLSKHSLVVEKSTKGSDEDIICCADM